MFKQEMTLEEHISDCDRRAADMRTLDFRPPLEQCKYDLAEATKENFVRAQGPDGKAWAPLKRPREDGRTHPLWKTGRLAASTGVGGEGHVERIEALWLIYGTNLFYAAAHQYGHTWSVPTRYRLPHQKPWVFKGADGKLVFTRKIKAHSWTVPARPFMGIGPKLQERFNERFRNFMLQRMTG